MQLLKRWPHGPLDIPEEAINMSKYHITHACGCTTTRNIAGTNVRGEREQKAKWLSSQDCAECKDEAIKKTPYHRIGLI